MAADSQEGSWPSPSPSPSAIKPKKSGEDESPMPMVVEWANVGLKVDIKVGKKKDETVEKHILKGVTGVARPGELLAIMGPSGAGKTTLLNCLAARTVPTSGTISYSGRPLAGASHRIAYVHQQEMLLPMMTPKEHLNFQAALRMPQSVPPSVRAERIAKAIELVGLTKCQNQFIGDMYGGLSKSEKRRVSFATEILSDPLVLLADEPTTGLDSAIAEIIVKHLKSLSTKGTGGLPVSVVATIHQPSAEVFRLFDRLCLVLDGHVGYMGPASELSAFLNSINFTVPPHTPPAEFMMDVCIDPRNPEQAAKSRETICDAWAAQEKESGLLPSGTADQAPSSRMGSALSSKARTYAASFGTQVAHVARREVMLTLRAKNQWVKLILFAVFGFLVGLTYFQVDIDSTGVLTLNQSYWFAFMLTVFSEAFFNIIGMPEQMSTLIREQRNGAYSPLALFFAKSLADLPFTVIPNFCWGTMLFYMVGYRDELEKFAIFTTTVVLLSLTSAAIGQLATFAASNGAIAAIVCFLNILPVMLFGGALINYDSVPDYFVWLKEISVFRYAYTAAMISQWEDYGPIAAASNNDNSQERTFEDGQAVLDFFGIHSWESIGMCWVAIVIIGLMYRTLAMLVLLKRSQPRQFENAAPEDDTKGTMGKKAGENEEAESKAKTPNGQASLALSLEWRSLTVMAKKGRGDGGGLVPIIENCSGAVSPGELVAVMGPSGCGKSMLLKTLANVAELPLSNGEVLVNGSPWNADCRKFACYLHQEESFFAGLTVREHLLFQLQLRIGRLPVEERVERVDKWIRVLGLTKCQHTLIGEIGSGISGGERKRLAFAAEAAVNPLLFFVDEPTSGLDSSMARNVIELLRDLCQGVDGGPRRTILASIHQPSAYIFSLFDKLTLLAGGRTVYCGPTASVRDHFSSVGLECPQDMSPAEYVMQCVTSHAGDPVSAGRSAAALEKLLQVAAATTETRPASTPEMASLMKKDDELASTVGTQVRTLMRRESLVRRRSKLLFKAVIARTFFMAILLGLLYFQVDSDQGGVQSIMGALTIIMMNTFMTSALGLILEIPLQLRAALRESKQGMYTLTSWFWAKTLTDLPIDAIAASAGVTILFWMIGFKDDAGAYAIFVLAAVVLSWGGNAFGYLSAMGGGRPEFAMGIFFITIFPTIMFSGFMVVSDDIPDYFKWLESCSLFRYVYSEMAAAVWKDFGDIDGCGDGSCPFPDGDGVLDFYGVKTDRAALHWSIICAYVVGARLIAWGLLVLRGRNPDGSLLSCGKRR